MAREDSISPWLKWVVGVLLLAPGLFLTYALVFSPTIDVVGVVWDVGHHGRKAWFCDITFAAGGNPHIVHVGPEVCRALQEKDNVRVVYRDWDLVGTRVEILSGRSQGRVWKGGLVEYGVGPFFLLLGFGVLWSASGGSRNKWYLHLVATEPQEKEK